MWRECRLSPCRPARDNWWAKPLPRRVYTRCERGEVALYWDRIKNTIIVRLRTWREILFGARVFAVLGAAAFLACMTVLALRPVAGALVELVANLAGRSTGAATAASNIPMDIAGAGNIPMDVGFAAAAAGSGFSRDSGTFWPRRGPSCRKCRTEPPGRHQTPCCRFLGPGPTMAGPRCT